MEGGKRADQGKGGAERVFGRVGFQSRSKAQMRSAHGGRGRVAFVRGQTRIDGSLRRFGER